MAQGMLEPSVNDQQVAEARRTPLQRSRSKTPQLNSSQLNMNQRSGKAQTGFSTIMQRPPSQSSKISNFGKNRQQSNEKRPARRQSFIKQNKKQLSKFVNTRKPPQTIPTSNCQQSQQSNEETLLQHTGDGVPKQRVNKSLFFNPADLSINSGYVTTKSMRPHTKQKPSFDTKEQSKLMRANEFDLKRRSAATTKSNQKAIVGCNSGMKARMSIGQAITSPAMQSNNGQQVSSMLSPGPWSPQNNHEFASTQRVELQQHQRLGMQQKQVSGLSQNGENSDLNFVFSHEKQPDNVFNQTLPTPSLFDQHDRNSAQFNILEQIKNDRYNFADTPDQRDNFIDGQRLSMTLQEQGQTYQSQAHQPNHMPYQR